MSFTITLSPSGTSFEAEPGQRILAAGLAAGVRMPFGCRMGTCRACKGRIAEGEIEAGSVHRTYLPEDQQAEGYALLCQAKACSDLVVEVEEAPFLTESMRLPAYVKAVEHLAPDVAMVLLRVPLHSSVRFAAGQFLDIHLDGDVTRSYSLANAPSAGGAIDLMLHVRHLPGGRFTDYVFGSMGLRDKLEVTVPLGSFYLRDSAQPAILLASGTGYAPIRSILLAAIEGGDRRHFKVYWGGRRPVDIYSMDEMRDMAAANANIEFIPVISDDLPSAEWSGRRGFVHRAVLEDHPDLSGWQVYACGTPVMVDAARADFTAQANLQSDAFFSDAFVSEADIARATAA